MRLPFRALAAFALTITTSAAANAQDDLPMDGGGEALDGPRFGRIEETFCASNGRGVHMVLEFGDPKEANRARKFIKPIRTSLQEDARAQFNLRGLFIGQSTNQTLQDNKITNWNYYLQGKLVKNCKPTQLDMR